MKNINHIERGCAMAGNRGGTLMKLLLFIVVFCGVLSAAWIYFLPAILTSTLHKHTGFGIKVTELSFNPFNAKVDLNGFIITNPEGFPRPEFIEVTSFNANAKLKTLFSSRPEFDYARVEVAHVAFVRDADGVLNAQLFNDRLSPPTPAQLAEKEEARKAAIKARSSSVPDVSVSKGGPVEKPKPAKPFAAKDAKTPTTKDAASKDKKGKDTEVVPVQKPMQFLIRRLELRLEKVIIADYMGATPVVREYNCKLYYSFNDVSDPKQLLAPFALKSLQSVGLALRGLIPGDIGKTMDAATKSPEPLLKKEPGTPGEDLLKSVVEKLEETQKP
jgi:hypothetical protein